MPQIKSITQVIPFSQTHTKLDTLFRTVSHEIIYTVSQQRGKKPDRLQWHIPVVVNFYLR